MYSTKQHKDEMRIKGHVTNFLPRKGFGFVTGEDGVQVFIHFSDIRGKAFRTLVEGEEVEYSVTKGPKGLQAVDLVRLDPPDVVDVNPIIPDSKTW